MAKFLCLNNSGMRALLNVEDISALYEQRDGTVVAICKGEILSGEDNFSDIHALLDVIELPKAPH